MYKRQDILCPVPSQKNLLLEILLRRLYTFTILHLLHVNFKDSFAFAPMCLRLLVYVFVSLSVSCSSLCQSAAGRRVLRLPIPARILLHSHSVEGLQQHFWRGSTIDIKLFTLPNFRKQARGCPKIDHIFGSRVPFSNTPSQIIRRVAGIRPPYEASV